MTNQPKHPRVICRVCKKDIPWDPKLHDDLGDDVTIEAICDVCFKRAWDYARSLG